VYLVCKNVYLDVLTLSIIIIIIISLSIPFRYYFPNAYSQQQDQTSNSTNELEQGVGPFVKDPNLKVEKVIDGLAWPFLDQMIFLCWNNTMVQYKEH